MRVTAKGPRRMALLRLCGCGERGRSRATDMGLRIYRGARRLAAGQGRERRGGSDRRAGDIDREGGVAARWGGRSRVYHHRVLR